MPKSFEYALELPQPPETVFRVLTDSARWRHTRLYGDIRWTEGEPWTPGSVREVESLVPYPARHRQRVLAVHRNELLELISYGFGYTNHVQLALTLTPGGGTKLRITNLVEGDLPLGDGVVLETYMERFVATYREELRRLCAEEAGK
jgi:uncharacterized protein YndB with AHSA1/START domain